MSNITQNVIAVLWHLDIRGVVIMETLRDRVRALDTLGELQKHIEDHPEHWMEDIWDPLHEGRVSHSYREKQRPSLQCCTHPISQINPNHPPEDHYCELDVDFSPPDSPLNFLRHSLEVVRNEATRHTTNQDEAGRLLAERFQKEQVNA